LGENKHLISIIVPCFNAQDYINDFFASLYSQKWHNWECLIYEDGSQDKSRNMLLEYAKKDHRIRIILADVNLGISNALNKLIEMSEGDIICRMDIDDLFYGTRRFERTVLALKDANFCFGNAVAFNSSWTRYTSVNSSEKVDVNILSKGRLIHPTFAFRSEVKNVVIYKDEYNRVEDTVLWYELFVIGPYKYSIIPHNLIWYRARKKRGRPYRKTQKAALRFILNNKKNIECISLFRILTLRIIRYFGSFIF